MEQHRITSQSKSDSHLVWKWVAYRLMTKSVTKPIDVLMRPYVAIPSNIAVLLFSLIFWTLTVTIQTSTE